MIRGRLLVCLSGVLLASCVNFEQSDGQTKFESVNRSTMLVRLESSPPNAGVEISCAGDAQFFRVTKTPRTIRIPVTAPCTFAFSKEHFEPAIVEFDPRRLERVQRLGLEKEDLDCNDPGVICDSDEGFFAALAEGMVVGLLGVAARAFDPVREGAEKLAVTLIPAEGFPGAEELPPARPLVIPDSEKTD